MKPSQKDPARLLLEQTGLGRQLLLAASEGPPPPNGLAARTMAAVTLGHPLGTAAVAAKAAGFGRVSASVILQWFGGGALVGMLAMGAAQAVKVAPATSPTLTARSKGQGMTPPSRAVPASPATEATPTRPPRAPTPHLPLVPATRYRLGDEAQLVDQATRAVQVRAPESALSLLDRYDRAFPNGQLAPEANLIRLRAYVQTGAHAQAEILAARLLRLNPRGTYADRVRNIVGAGKNVGETDQNHQQP